ncbi:SdpI family protein [Umezawaea tangerina]|uniref:SdpI family protein n=1 Tax=Umezawaea tangerina TaxID=84725 RepID=UPI000D04C0B1|nr:SdpI family protein [Umezawaea tangerina]
MNIVLPVVLGLVGVFLGLIGYLGLSGKLPRNRYVGVRTAPAMRDDEAFLLANRVAGLPNVVAAVVAVGAGTAAVVNPDAALTVGVVGVVGAVAITIAGTAVGHRAAEAMPEPEAPKGCGGCACAGGGCSTFSRA